MCALKVRGSSNGPGVIVRDLTNSLFGVRPNFVQEFRTCMRVDLNLPGLFGSYLRWNFVFLTRSLSSLLTQLNVSDKVLCYFQHVYIGDFSLFSLS